MGRKVQDTYTFSLVLIMRVTIFFTSLVLFATGILLAIRDQAAAAGTSYTAAVLCLIFVFLSEFKKFKGLGIEAELLDRKLEEAEVLLSRLRGITVPIAEMLFSTSARMGRWSSGMPRLQQHELTQRIERELLSCGVSASDIDRAKADVHYYNIFDLCSPVLQKISDAMQPKIRERELAIQKFPQPITPERKPEFEGLIQLRNAALADRERVQATRTLKRFADIPAHIRSVVEQSQLLDASEKQNLLEQVAEEILDVEHYIQYKEFRRPSVWFGQGGE